MDVQFAPANDNKLSATVTVTLTPEDYKPAVEAELKKVQRQATVSGFRPGKAPMGLVKKNHGRSVLVDEVNRLASDKLFGYLRDEKIDFLGQPLMSQEAESKINFEVEEDFVFAFDLGLAPDFKVNLSNEDVVTKYKVIITDEMLAEEVANVRKRFAEVSDVEKADEKDVIYGEVTELDDKGEAFEGGVTNQAVSLTADLVKSADLQKQLIGIEKGAEITVDIFALFNDNETVLSNTLNIPKEGVNDLNKEFKLKVTEIKHYVDAEVNQELFDKIFGKDAITTEEEFHQKIKESIAGYYDNESNNHVEHEVSHIISDKHDFELPDAFLKRWLVDTQPDTYKAEGIDEKYEQEKPGIRYSLVRERLQNEHKLEVKPEDIESASLGYTHNLFAQYGMNNPDQATVQAFSQEQLNKEEYRNKMADIAMNRVIIQLVKNEIVTIEEKEVSVQEFYDIISAHNKEHHAQEHGHEGHNHD